MNILSPLIPFGLSTLFGDGPFAFADPAQGEGFAYFGAGIWVVILVAAVIARPRWLALRAWTISNAPFLLVCMMLTLFALGPKITVGPRVVFEYDAGWWGPFAVFRATGRMFWPVFYAIVCATLGAIAIRVRHDYAVALLSGAVLVQAIDISGVYAASRKSHAERIEAMPLSSPFWTEVLPHYKHLVLHPTNMCPPHQGQVLDYRIFALHAASAGTTINGGFAARYDVQKVREYCARFGEDVSAGRVTDDSLWVLLLQEDASELMAASAQPLVCTPVDGYTACFTRASHLRWQSNYDHDSAHLPR